MAKLSSYNPSKNYKKIGEVQISTKAEIKNKVKIAKQAGLKWAGLDISERIGYLRNVYIALKKRSNEISKLASTEMGFPQKIHMSFDMDDGLYYFKWYMKNAARILSPETTYKNKAEEHQVYYEPLGVAAVIQPWNFPFCQWSWSVVPNLIAGNTVVFKHSEECPLTGKLIEKIVNSTNLPGGVFNEVYGDGSVGKMLLDKDIDLIVFTGSVKTGKKVYQVASKKFVKVLLELGGSAPGIVFKDADLDLALDSIYGARFSNNGQTCDGLKRLIVHRSIFDKVVDGLVKRHEGKLLGDPLDEKTDFGPLVAERQQKLILSQVNDAKRKGAKVIIGGKIPKELKGAYFEPTILINIKKNMRVWQEEVFGPVLPIVKFSTEEEAIKLANDTEYGLGGYVYSKDLDKAQRVAKKLKTGMVSINGANYVLPCNPFGGYKFSGLGREHGHWGLRELCEVKVVAESK